MYATFHDTAPEKGDHYVFQTIGDGHRFALVLDPTTGTHEVLDDWSGPAAGQSPGAAAITSFDGPVSEAQAEAGTQDHLLRLKPASATTEGFVRGLLLWEPHARAVKAVILSTTFDLLEAGSQAVYTTPVPPEVDPALLSKPDRIEICRVIP
ncbi:hypothetical protein [Spirillospora sp. CA-294931]|uniref:hypothetical protein n=1 Tax=Spirillospora sp. CA-294931 TaxID=3240042 RepID=UPI003D8B2299